MTVSPGVPFVRMADDGSHWAVRGGHLEYWSSYDTLAQSFPLGVMVQPGDLVRIFVRLKRISVYINAVRVISIEDTRNMSSSLHGLSTDDPLARMDDFRLLKSYDPAVAVAKDVNVKFVPNA